jgi:hypothetical protein
MSKIIEKEYKILKVDNKNKNFRAYTKEIVEGWIENQKQNEDEEVINGYELEYAIDNEEEGVFRDIYNDFILDSLSCGIVRNLRIDDKGYLVGLVSFKPPKFCNDLTGEIYDKESDLEKYAIVPKGKGSVKNQEVQNDYELYGFNLIMKEESSFYYEDEVEGINITK